MGLFFTSKSPIDIIKASHKHQLHFQKAGDHMPSDKEMLNYLIDSYTSLQRIKKSNDAEKEINYQLKILKAKLESFGIVTTDLDL